MADFSKTDPIIYRPGISGYSPLLRTEKSDDKWLNGKIPYQRCIYIPLLICDVQWLVRCRIVTCFMRCICRVIIITYSKRCICRVITYSKRCICRVITYSKRCICRVIIYSKRCICRVIIYSKRCICRIIIYSKRCICRVIIYSKRCICRVIIYSKRCICRVIIYSKRCSCVKFALSLLSYIGALITGISTYIGPVYFSTEPVFIRSFDVDEYVYIFFRETAIEYMNCGKAIYSRVARICKVTNLNWFYELSLFSCFVYHQFCLIWLYLFIYWYN